MRTTAFSFVVTVRRHHPHYCWPVLQLEQVPLQPGPGPAQEQVPVRALLWAPKLVLAPAPAWAPGQALAQQQ